MIYGAPQLEIVQDTTDLNFSKRHHTKGLGRIGTNQTGAESLGLKLHSSLALTTDGLPLGVLRVPAAAILTGILFGAAHLGSAPAQYLVPLGLFGVILCVVRWRTGSLYRS